MGKTLIILSHPTIEKSIGNSSISQALIEKDNIEIRHIDKLYPDFNINIEAEQAALLNADTIVFQFPLFWYNIPGMLKHWIDEVMLYGFAFGTGSKLNNKKVIVSFTIGSPAKLYPSEVIEKIVFPLKGLAEYCKMEYLGELFSNDINGYTEEAKAKATEIACKHAEQLYSMINKS